MPRPPKSPRPAVACLRCDIPMTPASMGALRMALTPPGRSKLRSGLSASLYVCPRCGRVELQADDPAAFALDAS
ncbi:hypothetical protein [Corallococcus macrosporus]|uniref:Uncharacterized protein n=1 Tax=Corallococcus macrosporus DSM 14697 TaxID=1189310 RepID=A0A250JMF3_9BACT|nr:hypothetical protein [Corallococcus macrosporus]ATB44677.1 hypothetical protein MYMAC_000248 [Corallococcus macrosporus DSM 14697]